MFPKQRGFSSSTDDSNSSGSGSGSSGGGGGNNERDEDDEELVLPDEVASGSQGDLIKTADGADTPDLIHKVEAIGGAIMDPGIPRPPVMLAIKTSKPVLPGVMHHMFVSDAEWIKALRDQGRDRMFFVSAFWEKTPQADAVIGMCLIFYVPGSSYSYFYEFGLFEQTCFCDQVTTSHLRWTTSKRH